MRRILPPTDVLLELVNATGEFYPTLDSFLTRHLTPDAARKLSPEAKAARQRAMVRRSHAKRRKPQTLFHRPDATSLPIEEALWAADSRRDPDAMQEEAVMPDGRSAR